MGSGFTVEVGTIALSSPKGGGFFREYSGRCWVYRVGGYKSVGFGVREGVLGFWVLGSYKDRKARAMVLFEV